VVALIAFRTYNRVAWIASEASPPGEVFSPINPPEIAGRSCSTMKQSRESLRHRAQNSKQQRFTLQLMIKTKCLFLARRVLA